MHKYSGSNGEETPLSCIKKFHMQAKMMLYGVLTWFEGSMGNDIISELCLEIQQLLHRLIAISGAGSVNKCGLQHVTLI
jgi:hypothetical protein